MERVPTPESISATEVIDKLREKGLEDQEALVLLTRWLDETGARVLRGEMRETQRLVGLAEIYRDAELAGEAYDAFVDAGDIAYGMGEHDTARYCDEEAAKLSGDSEKRT